MVSAPSRISPISTFAESWISPNHSRTQPRYAKVVSEGGQKRVSVRYALNCTNISWWPLTKTSDIDKKCLVKTNRKIFHSNKAGGLIGASFKQIYIAICLKNCFSSMEQTFCARNISGLIKRGTFLGYPFQTNYFCYFRMQTMKKRAENTSHKTRMDSRKFEKRQKVKPKKNI